MTRLDTSTGCPTSVLQHIERFELPSPVAVCNEDPRGSVSPRQSLDVTLWLLRSHAPLPGRRDSVGFEARCTYTGLLAVAQRQCRQNQRGRHCGFGAVELRKVPDSVEDQDLPRATPTDEFREQLAANKMHAPTATLDVLNQRMEPAGCSPATAVTGREAVRDCAAAGAARPAVAETSSMVEALAMRCAYACRLGSPQKLVAHVRRTDPASDGHP